MKTSSVVRYLEAYTFNAFFGQTQTLNLAGYQGRSPCLVRAADIVMDRTAKAIEIEDIEARVSELERAAEASKPGHTRNR
jgi:hypothetical protein